MRDSHAQCKNNQSVLGIVPGLRGVIPVVEHFNERTNKADQQNNRNRYSGSPRAHAHKYTPAASEHDENARSGLTGAHFGAYCARAVSDVCSKVMRLDGSSHALLKALDYGDDADNLRYDPDHKRIYVGYGGGALAEIDADGKKAGEIKFDSHPESFQLERDSPRICVNLPKLRKIAVLDREARTIITTWPLGMTLANYPMALDEADHRLLVVTRYPARLLVFDTTTGKTVQRLPAVGDCDDVFYDKSGKRIYAIGGEGAISVFEEQDPDNYKESTKITTVKGARTGFFSPELDRLFVAVRRQGNESAAIRVFAPVR
jgi:DNA-binding beta-propeller fold protein YncE